MMKKVLFLALGTLIALPGAFANFATPPSLIVGAEAPSGHQEYSLAHDAQNVHAKYITDLGIDDKTGLNIQEALEKVSPYAETVATNYQQNNVFDLYHENSSYSRIVVEAPAAGSYQISLSTFDATWQMPVIVYTNSYENVLNTTLSQTTWWNKTELQYSTIPVTLNEGRNVIVIQYNSWGNLVTFTLPEELTLVDFGSNEEGVYNQADFAWNCTWVENPQESLWNPDIYPEFTYIKNDGSTEYEGAAEINFTSQSTTESLDFTIQADVLSGLEATLRFTVNGAASDYTFNVSDLGSRVDVHLPSYFLDEIGFAGGTETNLRISNPNGGQEIRIIEMRESSVIDEEPVVVEGVKYEGESLKNAVLVHGRSLPLEDGIALDWSGAGIEFDVTGGGSVRGAFTLDGNSSNTRFVVEINGEFSHYFVPGSDVLMLSDLPSESTHVRLYKTSEANGNLVSLNSLTHFLPEGAEGSITKATDTSTSKMLFLGASIISGNQMNADGDEDQYQAFPTLLAKAWNADSEFVSASGRGVIQGTLGESGWASDNTHQISHIWTKTSYFRDPNAEYDISSYVPDLIVTNLGNNDLGQCDNFGNTEEDIANASRDFLASLREIYPSTKIIFTWGLGTVHSATAAETFKTAIEGLNDENVAFLNFAPQLQGQGGHPSYYQHDYIASEISRLYASMLETEDPYTRKYTWSSYEAEDGEISGASITNENPGVAQNWSGMAYVGDFNTNYLELDEIASDANNVSHIKLDVSVPTDGVYQLQIGYATNATTSIAYNVDGGDYTLVENLNSGDWCGGHGVYATSNVSLTAGNHALILTGPLNSGWLNYDYVNLLYLSTSEAVLAADTWSENFLGVSGTTCDPTGVNIFPTETWNQFADSFAELSSEAKSLLISSPKYEAMRERYTYIQSKYQYEDFLISSQGRVLKNSLNINAPSVNDPFDSDNLALFILGGLLGLGLLSGAYFTIKKRKDAHK